MPGVVDPGVGGAKRGELFPVEVEEFLAVGEGDHVVCLAVQEQDWFVDVANLGLVHKDVPEPVQRDRIKHHPHGRQESGLQDHSPDYKNVENKSKRKKKKWGGTLEVGLRNKKGLEANHLASLRPDDRWVLHQDSFQT